MRQAAVALENTPGGKAPAPSEIPALRLPAASVDEHCRAMRQAKCLYYWWFMGTCGLPWNYSLPFQDGDGTWWYQVKPGFCWPADCFNPLPVQRKKINVIKRFLGYQHAVSGQEANSKLIINVVEDLDGFGMHTLTDKRRNVRAGLKACTLEVLKSPDAKMLAECRALWNEFSVRTAWKRPVGEKKFADGWRRLLDIPGAGIVIGREAATGEVAGFLITKVIGDTAYVDTIASSAKHLKTRVNDVLMHSFVMNVRNMPNIRRAHYSIVSYKETLERFKKSHGFKPAVFPAYTCLEPAVEMLMKNCRAKDYDRVMGRMEVGAC